MTAEAVKRSCSGKTFEIELVKGWPGEPYYWGNRSVHEEEVEAAIHGMAPNGELQLLSVRAERDTSDKPRARILKSKDDTALLFIANQPEEAKIFSGVVGCLRRSLLIRPPLVVRTNMRAAATRPRQCRRSPQTRAE